LVNELRAAMAREHSLSGLLPICGRCKKIRDEQGAWTQVEQFISAHTAASFSHGLCPDCLEQAKPDWMKEKPV
jgi:hypothetical protein